MQQLNDTVCIKGEENYKLKVKVKNKKVGDTGNNLMLIRGSTTL